MSNFDLRKYLKENKWTYNDSKSIKHTFGTLGEGKVTHKSVAGDTSTINVDLKLIDKIVKQLEPIISKKAKLTTNDYERIVNYIVKMLSGYSQTGGGSLSVSEIVESDSLTLDEKAPQMKKSPKNYRLIQIIKQLEVLSDDDSTFNQSEVKKVQAAVKKLRTVWFK